VTETSPTADTPSDSRPSAADPGDGQDPAQRVPTGPAALSPATGPIRHGAWGRLLRSRRGRPLRALQHRAYTVLWLSFLVGQLGFWVSNIALQWVVADMTGSDPFMLGLLWFFMLIPLLLLSPVAGVVADRVNRKLIVVTSQATIATLAAALSLLTYLDVLSPPSLFALAFGVGCALALNGPANQAIVANAVPMRDLPSAISLQSIGMNMSRVAGPALAAPVLLAWGAAPAFGVYAVTASITAVALARIRIAPTPVDTSTESLWTRLQAGLRHTRERKPASTMLLMVGTIAIFGASYSALLPVFAYELLERGDEAFTALVIVTGAGAAVGSLWTGYRDSQPRMVIATTQMLLLGLSLVAFAVTTYWPLSLALAGIAGLLNFASMTTLNAMLQHVVDDQMRGRVMSLYVLCWGGLIPIGVLLLGAVASVVGTTLAVAGFGGVCAAAAVVLTVRYTLRPEQQTAEAAEPAPTPADARA
jgi:MFS family permease